MGARPYVEATLAAAVAAQVDRALLAELVTAGGVGVADVGAAVAAVVAAGWSDVVLIVPLASAVMDAANYAALGQLGSAVVVDAHTAQHAGVHRSSTIRLGSNTDRGRPRCISSGYPLESLV